MILLLIIPVCFALGFTVYAYRTCFYSPADRVQDPYAPMHGRQYEAVIDTILACTRVMDEAPYESVCVQSFDGLTLRGRLYRVKENAPVQILFHGYKSMAIRDCAGGFALSLQLGFNVLAVDQRAHGTSDGNAISFGINERRDCRTWAEYVSRRFGEDTPILLSGVSMGAATVLMASDMPLPKSLAGIIADCPYYAPEAIIRKVCADRHFPVAVTMPFIRLGARIFGHFNLDETSSLEAVKKAGVPILLFHGEDDRFVPWDMSKRIAAACASPVSFYSFPGAGHGLAYVVNRSRYEAATVQFLWKIPALRPFLDGNTFVDKRLTVSL